MSRHTDPSALRWLIGAELSNYRKQPGLTLTEVADATGIAKPKLGHMETRSSRWCCQVCCRPQEYAEPITRATGFVRADHAERFAPFRLARARRLGHAEPMRLHAVIGEGALRLRVGTRSYAGRN